MDEKELDVIEEVEESAEITEVEDDEEEEVESLLSLSYSITRDEQAEALDAEFRVKRLPMLILMSVLAVAILVLLIQKVVVAGALFSDIVLVVMLAGITLVNWLHPIKRKRQLLDLMEELKNDTYTCDVFAQGMEIRTVVEGERNKRKPSVIYLGDRTTVAETPHTYAIMPGRELIYVLPKRALDAKGEEFLRGFFHKRLGRRLKLMKQA